MNDQSQPSLVPPMLDTAQGYWQRLMTKSPELIQVLTAAQRDELLTTLALSDFISEQLCRHPEWLPPLFEGQLQKRARQLYANELTQQLEHQTCEDSVKKILRDYRNREMVRLAWRDFNGYVDVNESLLDLSALAEALIIAAQNWLYNAMTLEFGTPCDDQGNPQPLLILGMGKLGGRELNFSSDIDLIFTFPEHGQTEGGRRHQENQQFFIRMGQKLVKLLNQVTVDGFVYRVDMRLRPYGDSGPLVVSFSGLEDYYQEQGRDWERYAMVKARVLGSSSPFVEQLNSLLRPFIYRRYLDFSAIESLRKMKQLISQEERRRQLVDNIKLGAGGIREIEFIVQSFQLIRGGREPTLRQPSILAALDNLHAIGQFDEICVTDLKESYRFLRRVENLLQAISDSQTQTLPDNELDWQRLCFALKFPTQAALRAELTATMTKVHYHFCQTIGGQDNEEVSDLWTQQLWSVQQDDLAKDLLIEQGVDADGLWPALKSWRETVAKRTIGPRGRDTLDKLMPLLLQEFVDLSHPAKAFIPVSKVLDKILTRTTYLELLYENPGARHQLAHLCLASPWISEQLAKFPMLLDELIDPSQLYDTTSLEDYHDELRQYLLRVPEDDMEQQMEALRQFKLSQQLKIAAADVTGVLPVMQVSDHLTLLAEAIIEQVVLQAWQQVSARHGVPPHLEQDNIGFAVIGYGKAGGIELGYGSDLDLVFVHNYSQIKYPDSLHTNGDRPIEIGHFYLKLAQRILHLFSTRTTSGGLYEVDMRLRPSGASGLLVSEIGAFGLYQQQEAWTWEHQALVRARFLFGDQSIAQQFKELRTKVLASKRDKQQLAEAVTKMRIKMRDHLLDIDDAHFDLKQSPGGIADIEFIAQYLVLANTHDYPQLAVWSDNSRIFEQLATLKLLSRNDAKQLIDAYCYLRDENHRLTLQQQKSRLPLDRVDPYAQHVIDIYQQVLCPSL